MCSANNSFLFLAHFIASKSVSDIILHKTDAIFSWTIETNPKSDHFNKMSLWLSHHRMKESMTIGVLIQSRTFDSLIGFSSQKNSPCM